MDPRNLGYINKDVNCYEKRMKILISVKMLIPVMYHANITKEVVPFGD